MRIFDDRTVFSSLKKSDETLFIDVSIIMVYKPKFDFNNQPDIIVEVISFEK